MERKVIFTISLLIVGFTSISANECQVGKRHSSSPWNGDPLKIFAFTSEQDGLTCVLSFNGLDEYFYHDKVVLTPRENKVVGMENGNMEYLDIDSSLNVNGWAELTFSIGSNDKFVATVNNVPVLSYTVKYTVNKITIHGSNISLCADPTWLVQENEVIVVPLNGRLPEKNGASRLKPMDSSIYLTLFSTSPLKPEIEIDGMKRYLTLQSGEILLSKDFYQSLPHKKYHLEVHTQKLLATINLKLGNDSRKLMEFQVAKLLSDIKISNYGTNFTVNMDITSILFTPIDETMTTTDTPLLESTESEFSGGLVAGIIISLLVILLAIVVVFVFYKKRKKSSFQKQNDLADGDKTTNTQEEMLLIEEIKDTRQDGHNDNSLPDNKKLVDRLPVSESYQMNGLEIRKLSMNIDHKDDTNKVQKLSLGQHTNKPNKVIMLIGQSGRGISTLINAMVNYIFRVRFEDNFRYVVDYGEHKSERLKKESKTDWVTAYVFNHIEGMPHDCNYVLIDTPGFNSSDGIKRDREMMQQLKIFLDQDYGIDFIDAVGLVTDASVLTTPLTVTQNYVHNGLLSLLGHDLQKNVFFMATYADINQQAENKDNIEYVYYKFNNAALSAFNKSNPNDPNNESIDKSIRIKNSRTLFEMGTKSMLKFFNNLENINPISLTVTREVLIERSQLQKILQDMGKSRDKLDSLCKQAEQHIQHLNRIAIKSFPLLGEEKINLMIESEKRYKMPHFEFRVKQLELEKEAAVYKKIQTITLNRETMIC